MSDVPLRTDHLSYSADRRRVYVVETQVPDTGAWVTWSAYLTRKEMWRQLREQREAWHGQDDVKFRSAVYISVKP